MTALNVLHHALGFGVTTLDNDLRKVMEPRTSPPQARLNAVRKLSEAGIPVSVNIAPIIPGLTDHEMPAILKAAAEAGATSVGSIGRGASISIGGHQIHGGQTFDVNNPPRTTGPGSTTVITWVSFKFSSNQETVLPFLKRALEGTKAIVNELSAM